MITFIFIFGADSQSSPAMRPCMFGPMCKRIMIVGKFKFHRWEPVKYSIFGFDRTDFNHIYITTSYYWWRIENSWWKNGQDYRIGSLAKRTYINENRHENGISNYIWQNDSAEILIFSRIVF